MAASSIKRGVAKWRHQYILAKARMAHQHIEKRLKSGMAQRQRSVTASSAKSKEK